MQTVAIFPEEWRLLSAFAAESILMQKIYSDAGIVRGFREILTGELRCMSILPFMIPYMHLKIEEEQTMWSFMGKKCVNIC